MLTAAEESGLRDMLTRSQTSSWVGTPLRGGLPGWVSRTALPTAAKELQGNTVLINGIAGVADGVWICEKSAADTYGWVPLDTAAGAGLGAIDFLVGTATGLLSGEIAVGTTPGGELGNTWASPTVDATHSGSAHVAHDYLTDVSGGSVTMTTGATIYDADTTSVSAPAGTWLVYARAQLIAPAAGGFFILYVRDGASATLFASGIQSSAVSGTNHMVISWIVTVGSTTTFKVSALCSQNAATLSDAGIYAVRLTA